MHRPVYILLSLLLAICFGRHVSADERLPNVILILADDLGYGELGCYGQKVITTPHIDQLASGGMRFTQFYAGSTVCAPSRCVLMTGRHTGHARVRGNGGGAGSFLRDTDVTPAEVLKNEGYVTAHCGKWGLGDPKIGEEGLPNRQGFDHFYGYLNHTHAHNYYPDYLWRDTKRVPVANVVTHLPRRNSPGGVATRKAAYSPDLITDEAIGFIERERANPFFLYWAPTLPHANNEARAANGSGAEVPDAGIYADLDWPEPDKGHAAMITRLDADVGRLLDRLDELGIADDTLILFTSDNGPHRESGQDPMRFDPNGHYRGFKRDLYEGGIRVPFIARWPARIATGSVTDHIGYFGDVISTLADAVGQPPPTDLDSISLLPVLTGNGKAQQQHDYLYWEFYEQGTKQAVRAGKWKAVRMPMQSGATELYDLEKDPGETTDLAGEHPDIVRQLEEHMDEAHRPDPNWHPRPKNR